VLTVSLLSGEPRHSLHGRSLQSLWSTRPYSGGPARAFSLKYRHMLSAWQLTHFHSHRRPGNVCITSNIRGYLQNSVSRDIHLQSCLQERYVLQPIKSRGILSYLFRSFKTYSQVSPRRSLPVASTNLKRALAETEDSLCDWFNW